MITSLQPRQDGYFWTYLLNDTTAGGNPLALKLLRSNLDNFGDRALRNIDSNVSQHEFPFRTVTMTIQPSIQAPKGVGAFCMDGRLFEQG